MRFILHYTQPGDVVFDGFCGTGMTGVAAQLCGERAEVQELGYRVQNDGAILNQEGKPCSKIGARQTILNDLSPAATFIACNYNRSTSGGSFEEVSMRAWQEVETEWSWMFSTLCGASEKIVEKAAAELKKCRTASECKSMLSSEDSLRTRLGDAHATFTIKRINYVVWLVKFFACSECGAELQFWDVASNRADWSIREEFKCPKCRRESVQKNH